jgi:hypothetical protein
MKDIITRILLAITFLICLTEVRAQYQCAGVGQKDGYVSLYVDAYDELNNSDAVFIGEVSEIKTLHPRNVPSPESTFEITLKVTNAWKGVESDSITVQRQCSLVKGRKYLIYANLSENKLVVGCRCNRTKRLSEAAIDLEVFNERKLKPLKIKKTVSETPVYETPKMM